MTDPIKLLGNVASPYTRKMVTYLRYKRIPYEVIWGLPEDVLKEMKIEAPAVSCITKGTKQYVLQNNV